MGTTSRRSERRTSAYRRGQPIALWLADGDRCHRAPLAAALDSRGFDSTRWNHLGDPILLRNGRIRLGVEDCKHYLRAGIKQPDLERHDNLIISIGGIKAKDGLRDCLTWAGIAVARQDDGSIDCEDGFCPLDSGPLEWREEFPRVADYIDTVNEGHRVGHMSLLKGEVARDISPNLCLNFIGLFGWGMQVSSTNSSRFRPPAARSPPRGGCRLPTRRDV